MVKVEDNAPAQQTGYSTPQWGAQIPIDPALQQQSQAGGPYAHYQAYAHYPGAYTAAQYPQYAAAQPQPAAPAPAASGGGGSSSKNDSADVAALHDALGSAGVDLRAEAESLQRATDAPPSGLRAQQQQAQHGDRARKQPATPSFDARHLGTTMRALGTQHKVARVPDDAVAYLALALRARLADLVGAMAAAAAHRTDTQFDRPASLYADGQPMWGLVIRADVGKQLAALERAERDDEARIRRERKERQDLQAAHAAQLAAHAPGGGGGGGGSAAGADGYDDDGAPRKKKKKDGPAVSARTMPAEMHTKMANVTANQAAGLSTAKYSWMSSGGAGAAAAASKAKATAAAAAAAAGSSGGASSAANSSWARPYQSSTKPVAAPVQVEDPRRAITMRDAMFVIEKERGHGGGRGSARGWV